MIHYWWSIPGVILMYVMYAFLTKQNSIYRSWDWFWLMWFIGSFPLWNFVSRVSENLLIDSFIYDLFMILAYVGTMIYLGEAQDFVSVQWFGMFLCVGGILLMKLGG